MDKFVLYLVLITILLLTTGCNQMRSNLSLPKINHKSELNDVKANNLKKNLYEKNFFRVENVDETIRITSYTPNNKINKKLIANAYKFNKLIYDKKKNKGNITDYIALKYNSDNTISTDWKRMDKFNIGTNSKSIFSKCKVTTDGVTSSALNTVLLPFALLGGPKGVSSLYQKAMCEEDHSIVHDDEFTDRVANFINAKINEKFVNLVDISKSSQKSFVQTIRMLQKDHTLETSSIDNSLNTLYITEYVKNNLNIGNLVEVASSKLDKKLSNKLFDEYFSSNIKNDNLNIGNLKEVASSELNEKLSNKIFDKYFSSNIKKVSDIDEFDDILNKCKKCDKLKFKQKYLGLSGWSFNDKNNDFSKLNTFFDSPDYIYLYEDNINVKHKKIDGERKGKMIIKSKYSDIYREFTYNLSCKKTSTQEVTRKVHKKSIGGVVGKLFGFGGTPYVFKRTNFTCKISDSDLKTLKSFDKVAKNREGYSKQLNFFPERSLHNYYADKKLKKAPTKKRKAAIYSAGSSITFDYWNDGYNVELDGEYQCRLVLNYKDNVYDMFTSGCDNYVNGYYHPSLQKLSTPQCGEISNVSSKKEAMKLFMKCSFNGSF